MGSIAAVVAAAVFSVTATSSNSNYTDKYLGSSINYHRGEKKGQEERKREQKERKRENKTTTSKASSAAPLPERTDRRKRINDS